MTDAGDSARSLPPCGLYRTGVALPGREEHVPAGVLVFFHNHSEQGPPLVLLPQSNRHNRWSFHERGYLVESEAFLAGLVPLKAEGFYILDRHVHIGEKEVLAERTLVQLGYNREGEAILFVGRFEENTIVFPERGYRFGSPDLFELLKPAGFLVPKPDRTLH